MTHPSTSPREHLLDICHPVGTKKGSKLVNDTITYSFRKNHDEEVRVSIREYQGRQYFDIRVFVEKETGHCEFLPTKKGIRLDAYTFPEFKRAVLALEDELRQRGLLEAEEHGK